MIGRPICAALFYSQDAKLDDGMLIETKQLNEMIGLSIKSPLHLILGRSPEVEYMIHIFFLIVAIANTSSITRHVASIFAAVSVGCTRNMMLVSPNSWATFKRFLGR